MDESKVREVIGVRDVTGRRRVLAVELGENLQIEVTGSDICGASLAITADAARALARQLNRMARRIEARNA